MSYRPQPSTAGLVATYRRKSDHVARGQSRFLQTVAAIARALFW